MKKRRIIKLQWFLSMLTDKLYNSYEKTDSCLNESSVIYLHKKKNRTELALIGASKVAVTKTENHPNSVIEME